MTTKEDNKKTVEEETAEEYTEAINQQKTDSLKVKFLSLYKNQNQRDEILEKGYNESFYNLEYQYAQQYIEINKEISKIVSEGTPIPNYWGKSIENAKFFPLNDKDKEILKHLKNIEVKYDEQDKKSFTAFFHFEQNSFFDLTVLKKTYKFDKKDDSYTESIGTQIEWKGDAPNIKLVKKKIKKGKTTSTITKEKKVESFFNIFESKKKEDDEDEDEDQDDEGMDEDISAEAEFVLNDLVPFSMEYYLDIQKLGDLEDMGADDEESEEEDDKPKKKKK
jgi:nucleosome assembly protein 1-like 1